MNKYSKYKIAINILILIIIFQAILLFHFLPKQVKRKAPVAFAARIAIVIDDWGYNVNNLHFLDEIPYSLTISILPNLYYSQDIARQVSNSNGREVILHLPLEPLPSEQMRLERNTIMTAMTEREIKDIFIKDVNNIPGLRGVSNHMGSKAIADPLVMGAVFREMQKKGLYFLDSMVSKNSVSEKLSREMKVKFAKRDVFLDNKSEVEYIKGQINKLKLRAKLRGFAIGIGHDRKLTLEVLKEVMPQLEKEGYKFVFVSELAK